MFQSIILPHAKQDIKTAIQWYDSKQKGLGAKFLTEVRDYVEFVKHHPDAYVIRYDNVRAAVLKKFPFMIHYIIDDINNIIVVSAVLHTSINPNVWQNR